MGPTRHQGAPCCLVSSRWPPLVFLCYSIFYIFNKNPYEVSSHLKLRRIAISVVALLGQEFQLSVISFSV